MLCPVCSGRRETAPGQGCGACRGTGFIPGLTTDAVHGLERLDNGAAHVKVPVPADAIILLTVQEVAGEPGQVSVSNRRGLEACGGFSISSSSPRDRSTVGWLIIG